MDSFMNLRNKKQKYFALKLLATRIVLLVRIKTVFSAKTKCNTHTHACMHMRTHIIKKSN